LIQITLAKVWLHPNPYFEMKMSFTNIILPGSKPLSIAAPCIPVIAALMCTTKRRVEGVGILELMGL
jgi:hypothetical protein